MRPTLLIAALALAACSGQPEADNAAPTNVAAATPAPTPTPTLAPVEPAAPGNAEGLPDENTPPDEAAFAATSAQGAADVVQHYFALVEQGAYPRAWRLWEEGASKPGADEFAASFAQYSEVHAEVGAPGEVDAGAGQRYVAVPVQVYGRLKDGAPFRKRATVTLHRVGDVDGATAEQKRWHIRGIE